MHYEFPTKYYRLIESKDNVVLLETSKFDEENYRSYLFTNPVETLVIHSVDEVSGLLSDIERFLKENYYLAGYFSYECGFAFETIAEIPSSPQPIAFFGVYRRPLVFDHRTGFFEDESDELPTSDLDNLTSSLPFHLNSPTLSISRQEYIARIETIKDYIRAGDTYQINFTGKYHFEFDRSSLELYAQLKKKQRVSYGAFIKSGGREIISLSPELFFKYADGMITVKPMKGTVRRGRTNDEDTQMKSWLQLDAKNRSENVMIVDLLRNDLGRICEPGTVSVQNLCSVEKYRTLFQMTSTVSGKLSNTVTATDILKNIFPSGSVTGAPKIRSMRIIHELEQQRRGIYTGAIGFFSPNNEAMFNVANRTLDVQSYQAEMGVGSGIVYESDPEQEFEECELKGKFLTSAPQEPFELLETLVWKNGFPFLDQHIRRLAQSALYFDYSCNTEDIKKLLTKAGDTFRQESIYKVRLTLNHNGQLSLNNEIIVERTPPVRVALSYSQMDSSNLFLFHKTTNRKFYDATYNEGLLHGFDDVIFMNERGEITEGSRNNIFAEIDGQLFTPPIYCGLLNGIYRQHILNTQANAVEQTLTESDLREAEAIYICNAVRGIRKVQLEDEKVKFHTEASK